jgi:hypothetical protein
MAINPSLQHGNKFILTFPRVSNTQYFCQSVSMPGISLAEIPRNTPYVDLYSPGEKLIYEPFNVTFLVDENLTSWKEIHDWMRGITFPTDYAEYAGLKDLSPFVNPNFPQFAEGILTVLSSSNKPHYKLRFVDSFPISLSSIIFSSTDTPDNIITADVTFRYSYFQLEFLY